MRTQRVVVAPPPLDDDFHLGTRAQLFEAEAPVTELAVEALVDDVLPRLAGMYQRRANALIEDALQHRASDETPGRCRNADVQAHHAG